MSLTLKLNKINCLCFFNKQRKLSVPIETCKRRKFNVQSMKCLELLKARECDISIVIDFIQSILSLSSGLFPLWCLFCTNISI